MTPIELVAAGGCAFVLLGVAEVALAFALAKLRGRW